MAVGAALEVQPQMPSCVLPDAHPVVGVQVTGEAKAVRVFFHSDAGKDFFYVEGTKTAEGWVAKLPRPMSPPTQTIHAYVEAIGKDESEAPRTRDYEISVQQACAAKPIAAPPGGVTIVGPGGALPIGFSPSGVASVLALETGGTILGMSTPVAIGVGAVVVAGAATGIVLATNDDESPQ
jgi:hypothetical protein